MLELEKMIIIWIVLNRWNIMNEQYVFAKWMARALDCFPCYIANQIMAKVRLLDLCPLMLSI